jgi:hypothetical protein
VVSILQVSTPKPWIPLSSHLYVLHAPPISFFSICYNINSCTKVQRCFGNVSFCRYREKGQHLSRCTNEELTIKTWWLLYCTNQLTPRNSAVLHAACWYVLCDCLILRVLMFFTGINRLVSITETQFLYCVIRYELTICLMYRLIADIRELKYGLLLETRDIATHTILD